MAVEVTMPQLSDTMHEGRILRWLKKEGDPVKRGEALAEVATDKADLEIEAFHDGTLIRIDAKVGDSVKVGTLIALIGEAGERAAPVGQPTPVKSSSVTPAASAVPVGHQQVAQPQAAPPAPSPAFSVSALSASVSRADGERVKISPLAKNLAASYGVDYKNISGSGEGGRIIRKDIEQVAGTTAPLANASAPLQAHLSIVPERTVSASAPSSAASTSTGSSTVTPASASTAPLSQMRRTIAERMAAAMREIPHFYVTTKIHVDQLVKMRESLKTLPAYEGVTFNHLLIRAAALTLRAFPRVNSAFRNGDLYQPGEISIGIITAVTDGLLIPVVKGADQLPLADTVAEARALVQRARAGRPKGTDLTGATFCISNMGMFAVEDFTAIINPGNGAILAVSAIADEPIADDGSVRVGKVLRVTLSLDHRIIDGVVAGEFLTEFKRLLEDPVLLLA